MNYTAEYPAKPKGVSKCLLFIEECLKEYRVNRRDMMEALLLCEEAMLLLSQHAPEDACMQVNITRQWGVPRIRVSMPGEPLSMDGEMGDLSVEQLGEETESVIRGIMLRSYADSIKYRHSRHTNYLSIVTGIPERALAVHTVAALALALAAGLLLRGTLSAPAVSWLITNILNPLESLFISALMCITAPAIFVSITCSTFRFEGFSELGRSGRRVISSYMLTSVVAALIGLLCFRLFLPGELGLLSDQGGSGGGGGFSLLTVLLSIIPHNIIEPFIKVNSIQLMITALAIGAALTMSGKRVRNLKTLLEELDVLCGKLSSLVMKVVPVVVFSSTVNVILSSRLELFGATAQLLLTMLAALAVMMLFDCLLLLAAARLNPITFLRKYGPTMKNTFLKGSGVAAIPMTMRVCRWRLGVPRNICSFSIPLGATINMDGNCVCLTIISLFFARICGAELSPNDIFILLCLVLILSLGAPIAPGTLILCLVTLLSQLDIDTGVISLIIGINFILEMLLGMVNCVGDVVVALIEARREGTLDMDVYRK